MLREQKDRVISIIKHEIMANFLELCKRNDVELPFDGDETEEIAEIFLGYLNWNSGNMNNEKYDKMEEEFYAE